MMTFQSGFLKEEMKIRCDLHVNGTSSKLLLVAKPEETADHLALKLAVCSMFHAFHPLVEPSSLHPSLAGVDIKPDLLILNSGGVITHWIECGVVSVRKLDKITKRFPGARVIVQKKSLREANQLRASLEDEIKHHRKVEIWAWPEGHFEPWVCALEDKTEIFGEAHEKFLNLVMNQTAFDVDLVSV